MASCSVITDTVAAARRRTWGYLAVGFGCLDKNWRPQGPKTPTTATTGAPAPAVSLCGSGDLLGGGSQRHAHLEGFPVPDHGEGDLIPGGMGPHVTGQRRGTGNRAVVDGRDDVALVDIGLGGRGAGFDRLDRGAGTGDVIHSRGVIGHGGSEAS